MKKKKCRQLRIWDRRGNMKYEVCPICGSPAEIKYSEPLKCLNHYKCFRCNLFVFHSDLDYITNNLTPVHVAIISGWIRDNYNPVFTEDVFRSLFDLSLPSFLTKVDLVLKYLAQNFPVAGQPIDYNFNKASEMYNSIITKTIPNENDKHPYQVFENTAKKLLPIFSIGRIIDNREFNYIVENYLIEEKKYLSRIPTMITPKGWAYIETLKQRKPNSKKAFVAMWFGDEMKKTCDDFIFPAIQEAGFDPIRIDNKEHNNDINDEIIGEIRSSRFIVADFTGNRGGVYYEAGFANGLKIPVIHMCKKEELKKVHFDVNHRNIIDWKSGEELYERLLNRIKATIV